MACNKGSSAAKSQTISWLELETINNDEPVTWDNLKQMCFYPKEKCLELIQNPNNTQYLGNFIFFYSPESQNPQKGLLYLVYSDSFLCINYDINSYNQFFGTAANIYPHGGISLLGDYIILTRNNNHTYMILGRLNTLKNKNDSTEKKKSKSKDEMMEYIEGKEHYQLFVYDLGKTVIDQAAYYKNVLYFNSLSDKTYGQITFENLTGTISKTKYKDSEQINLYITCHEEYYNNDNKQLWSHFSDETESHCLYDHETYRGGDGRGGTDYTWYFSFE